MRLTCEQAMERGLLVLDHSKGKPAQVGYDLSVKEIRQVEAGGAIFVDSTNAPILSPPLETEQDIVTGREVYYLEPGIYDITFWEGCKIPNNTTGVIVHRSGMYRNGAIIVSPIFDPGFYTDNIGCVLYLFTALTIEKNSRLAQITFDEHAPVDKPYDGQWQGDKWRESGNPSDN